MKKASFCSEDQTAGDDVAKKDSSYNLRLLYNIIVSCLFLIVFSSLISF